MKNFKDFKNDEEVYEAESKEMQNDLMDQLDQSFTTHSLTERKRLLLILKFVLECYAPSRLNKHAVEELRSALADDIEYGERIPTYSDETGTYR